MIRLRLLVLGIAVASGGCAYTDSIKADCVKGEVPGPMAIARVAGEAPAHDPAKDVLVRSLGSAGVYIQWQGAGVLVSPRFTAYPANARSLGRKLAADGAAIAAGLSKIEKSGVQAILVGGSDYERIADVVAVARALPNADIYVNQSGLNMLAAHVGQLEGRRGEKRTRIRAVNGDKLPRAAEQWVWLRGMDGGEIPIRIRAVPLKTPNPQAAPKSLIPLDNMHTDELFEGQRHAFAVELFDATRTKPQFELLAMGSGSKPDLKALDQEFDLLVVSLRRHASDKARASDLVQPTKAAHVMFVDYDLAHAKGQWTLHPDLDPKWVGRTLCGVDTALRTTGLKEREPRTSKTVYGGFWTMPSPGQWLVFSTATFEGLSNEEPAAGPLVAAYDRALLQSGEADLDGALKTLAGEIAAAQKEDRVDDPRLARLYVLAAAIVRKRDKNAAKARALLDRAIVLDHFVRLPIEFRDQKMKSLLAQARRAVTPPSEPIGLDDPVKHKDRTVSFEALIQVQAPENAQLVLYWRKMGVGEFASVPMRRLGNVATAELGAVAHRGADIEYFIYLFDDKQRPLANKGEQEDPLAFFLSD